ncbi:MULTISPECIES: nitronate monooxygenase [unclassified Leucobacter]|uniref:nitronate monooxygenase n=1 Tax=unclassified Leucobacter TaxID=2621730 RepID=UPI00165DF928|nr:MULTISPECIES: nitronate monooxygenase [unclassified Leucobacter]MBC9937277.1 nitronate monooxygenase [Leucobacter sp. cx-87]
MFDLRSLPAPIIAAPMAGGPTTPELAAAVSRSGGLGFVAGGYLTAAELRSRFSRARELAGPGALGINLFVPGPTVIDEEALEDYAARLAPYAAALGVTLELPRVGQDREDYEAKLALVGELAPEVVSFTFGCPTPDTLGWLRAQGICTSVTVTTRAEAEAALSAGATSLTLQGPDAGGHRGTFDQMAVPDATPLAILLDDVLATAGHTPVIAAGGISSPAAVAAVLSAGAVAAQLGTAFLLADEAGTHAVHRTALALPHETAPTRVFSGRYGRALVTEFASAMDLFAPAGFPEIHSLVAPLRAAALASDHPEFACLWAGTGFAEAIAAPASRIVAAMMPPRD